MYNINYDIELNDNGRPFINLPPDYEQNPEDRFFVLEIVRYMLQDLIIRNDNKLDNKTVDVMSNAENFIGQISDEVAHLIYGQMKSIGDVEMLMEREYHIKVNTIEERDLLPDKGILYDGKIFDRVEGLKVYINDIIYELVGGITNEHWVKL